MHENEPSKNEAHENEAYITIHFIDHGIELKDIRFGIILTTNNTLQQKLQMIVC